MKHREASLRGIPPWVYHPGIHPGYTTLVYTPGYTPMYTTLCTPWVYPMYTTLCTPLGIHPVYASLCTMVVSLLYMPPCVLWWVYLPIYTSLGTPPWVHHCYSRLFPVRSRLPRAGFRVPLPAEEALGSVLRLIRRVSAFCASERAEVSRFLCYSRAEQGCLRARIT